jgi:hypothetical protein
LNKCCELIFAHGLPPARQRRPIKRQPVLEKLFAAEEPVIRILNPALAQRLVRRSCMCFRMASPAISRVGNGGRPGSSS